MDNLITKRTWKKVFYRSYIVSLSSPDHLYRRRLVSEKPVTSQTKTKTITSLKSSYRLVHFPRSINSNFTVFLYVLWSDPTYHIPFSFNHPCGRYIMKKSLSRKTQRVQSTSPISLRVSTLLLEKGVQSNQFRWESSLWHQGFFRDYSLSFIPGTFLLLWGLDSEVTDNTFGSYNDD